MWDQNTPQPGNICFPESKAEVFCISHATHQIHVHTQREKDMREGAPSVLLKLNVHYRNKRAQRKRKRKKKKSNIAATLDI